MRNDDQGKEEGGSYDVRRDPPPPPPPLFLPLHRSSACHRRLALPVPHLPLRLPHQCRARIGREREPVWWNKKKRTSAYERGGKSQTGRNTLLKNPIRIIEKPKHNHHFQERFIHYILFWQSSSNTVIGVIALLAAHSPPSLSPSSFREATGENGVGGKW